MDLVQSFLPSPVVASAATYAFPVPALSARGDGDVEVGVAGPVPVLLSSPLTPDERVISWERFHCSPSQELGACLVEDTSPPRQQPSAELEQLSSQAALKDLHEELSCNPLGPRDGGLHRRLPWYALGAIEERRGTHPLPIPSSHICGPPQRLSSAAGRPPAIILCDSAACPSPPSMATSSVMPLTPSYRTYLSGSCSARSGSSTALRRRTHRVPSVSFVGSPEGLEAAASQRHTIQVPSFVWSTASSVESEDSLHPLPISYTLSGK